MMTAWAARARTPAGRRWTAALGGLAAVAVALLYFRFTFMGLAAPEAMELAQLGRNLSNGLGFTTFVLRPLALPHGTNPLAQPEMLHGPLFPFLLALIIGATGASDLAIAGASLFFHLLTIPVVFTLGRRLFDRRTAYFAAALYALNVEVLDVAGSGRPLTLCIFLMSCLFVTLYDLAAEDRNDDAKEASPARVSPTPRGRFRLAGALGGALYLTDPAFFWILPILLALAFHWNRRRPGALMALAGPMALLALPWMIRNYSVTGSPFFGLRGSEIWMNTGLFPGTIAYRMSDHDLAPSTAALNALMKKLVANTARETQALPMILGPWTLAFFLPSLFFQFSDEAANTLRRTGFALFLAVSLGMALFVPRHDLLMAFLPLVAVFSVAYLLHLIRQAGNSSLTARTAAVVALVVILFPLAGGVARQAPNSLRRAAAVAPWLHQYSRRGDIVFSDQPWVVAWYADRPSILLPLREARITQLRREFPGARWLFLTEEARAFSPMWSAIHDSFYQWNNIVAQARATGQTLPQPLLIAGPQPPLFAALAGFVSVEVGTDPGAVLGVVSPAAPKTVPTPPVTQPHRP